jgi:HPt (histidine-containing phosphotransfer) domain-containing protein
VTSVGTIDTDRLEMLRRLKPGDPSLLPRLVEAFLADVPAILIALRTAADARDSTELASSAHRLKGAALNLGVTAVGALCEQLETMGAAGQVDGAPQLLDRLETALDPVADTLHAIAGPVPR